MKNSAWEIIACIAIGICIFIGGYRAGAETAYNNGFKEGVEIAEEYAQECVFSLNHDVRDKFDISAYDAAMLINKYDDSSDSDCVYLFDKYSDLVNAHFALEYFINNIEYELANISEVSLELGEISSD